ncbi:MAG: sodium:calcium antiporter, partial [Chthoniobacterales bacterium]
EADIAVGNVVGSNIFNVLGILGISSAVTPLSSAGITDIDLGVMAGFAVVLWIFSRTGFRITRTEGLILLVAYVGYISWLILRS